MTATSTPTTPDRDASAADPWPEVASRVESSRLRRGGRHVRTEPAPKGAASTGAAPASPPRHRRA